MIMWAARSGRFWKAAGLGFFAAACSGPSLMVSTEPEDAVLLVDGRVTPNPEIPFRYYGDMNVQAQPAPQERERFDHLSIDRTVRIPEPVTPWVFPFDFVVEALLRPFGGAGDQAVTLTLPDNPDRVSAGLEPESADEVRTRSRSARVDR